MNVNFCGFGGRPCGIPSIVILYNVAYDAYKHNKFLVVIDAHGKLRFAGEK